MDQARARRSLIIKRDGYQKHRSTAIVNAGLIESILPMLPVLPPPKTLMQAIAVADKAINISGAGEPNEKCEWSEKEAEKIRNILLWLRARLKGSTDATHKSIANMKKLIRARNLLKDPLGPGGVPEADEAGDAVALSSSSEGWVDDPFEAEAPAAAASSSAWPSYPGSSSARTRPEPLRAPPPPTPCVSWCGMCCVLCGVVCRVWYVLCAMWCSVSCV